MAKKVLLKVINLFLLVAICTAGIAQPFPEKSIDNRALEKDTSWKSDHAFDYMNHIDSLLRKNNHLADSLKRIETKYEVKRSSGNSFLTNFINNSVVKIIFWLMLAAFIAFVFFRLFRFNIFKRAEQDDAPSEILQGGTLNIPEFYSEQIIHAEKNANFPLAIRYQFLRSLVLLNEKDIIHFLPEKTNVEYYIEMENEELKSSFSALSRVYEYVWYGNGKISVSQYDSVKEQFANFNKNI